MTSTADSHDVPTRRIAPTVLTPPGWRFRRVLNISCSRRLRRTVLEPLHAELADEWTEAHVDGSTWRIAMVAVRYYAGLGLLILRAPFTMFLRLWRR